MQFFKYYKLFGDMSSATYFGECSSLHSEEEGVSSTVGRIQQVTASGSLLYRKIYIFLPLRNSPSGPGPPHCRGFTIKLRHTTLGTTSLDE
jgi:hypothetical protein